MNPSTTKPGYWQICVHYILTRSFSPLDHDEVKTNLMLASMMKNNTFPLISTIILPNVLTMFYSVHLQTLAEICRISCGALKCLIFTRGVGGKYFKIIKSMFDNSKSRVKYNSNLSDIFENLLGVLQGGVISPTLFKFFLDDLGYRIKTEHPFLVEVSAQRRGRWQSHLTEAIAEVRWRASARVWGL